MIHPMLRQSLSSSLPDPEPIEAPGCVYEHRSPPADQNKDRLNILYRLVTDPLNTFCFEAASDEMDLFGIKKGTLLVVDRSRNPSGGMIVIARYKGAWLVRQLVTHVKRKYLITGKEKDPTLEINETSGILIWGVVTWSCCPQTEVENQFHPDEF